MGEPGNLYVALLKGINVSGRNQVSMSDLRALVAALPADDVVTYVQSGNVVFRTEVAAADRLAGLLADRVREQMGLDVTVLVRTGKELDRVVAANPFPTDNQDWTQFHVTFLAGLPDADRVSALGSVAQTAAPDAFQVRDREVYLHCPDGYGRTKLNNAFFERKLAVAATTRNWRTVIKLSEMARG